MEFIISMKEIHYQRVKIIAESKEEAIRKTEDGEGEYIELEYSHTLDKSQWLVEKG